MRGCADGFADPRILLRPIMATLAGEAASPFIFSGGQCILGHQLLAETGDADGRLREVAQQSLPTMPPT
jgi:hypothetical protein